MIVFLVGFMGSGKSSIGRKLASRMAYQFIDLDKYIESKAGKSVYHIFEEEGEDAFREMERNCLHELNNIDNSIIACGGGTPCFFNNMEWMNKQGLTVYLQMSPASLVQRLKQAASPRPLLKGLKSEDLPEFVGSALEKREKYYMSAHILVKAESLKAKELQEKILDFRK
jgi:shikimate kinase